ncbi:hypothetical protein bsdE14_38560 [Clostridium omnivorum]|uniref:Endonuclease III n=1 Tax=Clostridium omnivorum TaxID=1604902 RepID=A0ABQ5NB64_9CLOT|nr:hypothetical protein bsdE14_38560 [Clostridium sp. E14]
MFLRQEFYDFVLNIIKCFLILIIFGVLLPQIVDYFLYSIYKSNIYDNSILVYNLIDNNYKILYNYIYIFKLLFSA